MIIFRLLHPFQGLSSAGETECQMEFMSQCSNLGLFIKPPPEARHQLP